MTVPIILQDGIDGAFYHYAKILRVWQSRDPAAILPLLTEINAAVQSGAGHAVGFLTYEAAAAFDPAFVTHPPDPTLPLLWFALCEPPHSLPLPAPTGSHTPGEWLPDETEATFVRQIAAIHAAIAAGQSYQVNHTYRLRAPFRGDPYALFYQMALAQRGRFAAWIDGGEWAICSASPELFFRLENGVVTAQPMKGTAPRGLTLADDRAQMAALHTSEKNRAENVMIVDMIRNDLGRIALPGGVQVPALFEVTRYPTLHQMTSTVTARLSADTATDLPAIFRALFPCASITGAPKVRTMQLIRALESSPRGLYTGAIGTIAPGGQAQFSVAIRTAVIDRQRGTATYGVGSGIVQDSDAHDEYRETRLKAQVLSRTVVPTFGLLAALLWEPGRGWFLAERQRARLRDSAEYFDFPFDESAWEERLATLTPALTGPTKVRITLNRDGRFNATTTPVHPDPTPVRLWLPPGPVDPDSRWLFHKTTRREVYEEGTAGALAAGCDEPLLWNPDGHITESSTANVVLWRDGRWVTPPVSAGLLPGVYRAALLDVGLLHEEAISVAEARHASCLWLINSVRRWRPAFLAHPARSNRFSG
jgi:para-aminobenzoate synthetase/4-amino-4-deoxychorismate lyase